ncbi:pilus assembly protein PilM [Thiohalobacter sp. IOR34]|uniref:type IV pilus biogenesis protein PilM n=1 Tax=Thiohalobacter sp. IOR34 TaxID=3057176 RepID=UPI0025B094EC|nr:pilus assembly protein PilM [Thiohalobacter sp. IOR34]WJW75527.1 pilus assembly protein PilM [Thiohalobacter sp. IOR34]
MRRKSSNRRHAIVFNDGGLSHVCLAPGEDGSPRLQACERLTIGEEEVSSLLKQLVKRQGLSDQPCATLMDLGSYHLFLIEMPKVPPPEMKAAVRWQIKDMIDYHIDDAVLDIFDAPTSSARGSREHIYVVVARRQAVEDRARLMQEAGLELEVIDIPELALRNIAMRLPEAEKGLALLYQEAQRGLIALYRGSTLYLARTLDIGYQTFEAAETHAVLLDNLALEVQRTLDYYDRHFQQAPIRHLVSTPAPFEHPQLHQVMDASLGLASRTLAPAEIVAGVTDEIPAACILAIGCALRREEKKL